MTSFNEPPEEQTICFIVISESFCLRDKILEDFNKLQRRPSESEKSQNLNFGQQFPLNT